MRAPSTFLSIAGSIVYANGAFALRIAERSHRAATKSPANMQVFHRARIVARVLLFGIADASRSTSRVDSSERSDPSSVLRRKSL
jgi:hypothetical protein